MFEESFIKKLDVILVVSCLHKALTIEDGSAFKDPIHKFCEALSKFLFSPAGSALQPSMALMLVCPILGKWTKLMLKSPGSVHIDPLFVECLEHLFCLFGVALDSLIKDVRWGKSTHSSQLKKPTLRAGKTTSLLPPETKKSSFCCLQTSTFDAKPKPGAQFNLKPWASNPKRAYEF